MRGGYPLILVLALAGCFACTPRGARSSTSAVARRVEISDTDSLTVLHFDYRWTTVQRDSAMAVLAENRAKWAAYRPRRYEYRERRWCFCFSMWEGPRVLVVEDQRLVSATDTAGRRIDSAYVKAFRGKVAGIDALFAELAEGIRDTSFAEVRVKYDAAHGYPVSMTFDHSIMVSDDEYYVHVSHVRALP